MYIIVIGGGRIGYYLIKGLLEEGHEVLVVEQDETVCETINEELGTICVRGDGCEVATMAEVGTERAEMLIAVTGDDEDNLVSCQVAKHRFNVERTIARIRNPQNEFLFKALGVDVTISSTSLILESIETEVPTHSLTHLLSFEESGQEIVVVRITEESETVGKSVRELTLPEESRLVLVVREGGKTRVPTLNTTFREGDRVIALTTPESEEELRAVIRGE